MFRLSRFMEALVTGGEVPPRRAPPGPVVIWNVIRRCNLTCRHCYSLSNDTDFKGELSTEEALAVLAHIRLKVPDTPCLALDLCALSGNIKPLRWSSGAKSQFHTITLLVNKKAAISFPLIAAFSLYDIDRPSTGRCPGRGAWA